MLFIVQRVLHGPVQPPCRQVRLDPAIERSRSRIFIEPHPQLFQLFLRERSNHPLDFLNSFSAHVRRLPAIFVR